MCGACVSVRKCSSARFGSGTARNCFSIRSSGEGLRYPKMFTCPNTLAALSALKSAVLELPGLISSVDKIKREKFASCSLRKVRFVFDRH